MKAGTTGVTFSFKLPLREEQKCEVKASLFSGAPVIRLCLLHLHIHTLMDLKSVTLMFASLSSLVQRETSCSGPELIVEIDGTMLEMTENLRFIFR